MTQEKEKRIISFFSTNKFLVGLFSFLYCLLILFFILLAIILPLKKFGKVPLGQFIFIALPAWILIAIPLIILAEGQKWGIYPHWFWTAFKKVEFEPLYGKISFITGWWPFRYVKEYGGDLIKEFIISSKSYGDFGKKEKFSLQLSFNDNTKWTFLSHLKNEQELRQRARELTTVCQCELVDKTYGPILELKKKKVKSQEMPAKTDLFFSEKITAPEDISLIPKGIKEKKDKNGSLSLVITRVHEWPVHTFLSLFVIGIYVITVVLGWTNPKKPTAWEGLWGLILGIIIFLFLKSTMPVREIKVDSSTLYYRFKILGLTLKRKKMPVMNITKIAIQATELLSRRLIIISDSMTIKIGDLTPDAGEYLKSFLENF
jgi:hypothetical protein